MFELQSVSTVANDGQTDRQTDRKRSLIFKSVFHNIPSKFFLSLLSIQSSILDHRSKIVERIHRVCFKG